MPNDIPQSWTEKQKREKRIQIIIIDNTYWSAFLGFVPIPWVNIASIASIQIKMVNEIASEYEIPFSRVRTKALLMGLIGGMSSSVISQGLMSMGAAAGLSLPMALFLGSSAVATTYALGKIFDYHFSNGGTLEDMNVSNYRDYFEQMRAEGLRFANVSPIRTKN